MDKKFSLKINNQELKGVLENPKAKKLMILVHGFTGDWRGPKNLFEKLSKKLQQKDFAVLRFSFIGTPPSDGDFREMTLASETAELTKVIECAKSLGYKEIGVLGESMGGTVATTAYDPILKVVIFWYPAFDFIHTDLESLLNQENQEKLKKDSYILIDGFKVGKKFISQINSIDVFEKVRKIKCPVYFLHGDKDKEAPHFHSEKAFQLANEPKELHLIKGADHCFYDEQDEAIDLTLDFLKRYF